MLLFALVTVASVDAQNVYIAPSNSAIAYHKSKDCSYLRNSVNVTAITTAKAKDMGRHACVRCYPELKDKTMKAIAKEKATKKTTKKAAPARDEKGRFVKKADTEKKETAKKKATPARDEKGRFVKKADTEKKETAKKSAPARDEKGRFVKKADTEKKETAKKKTAPARDEKGRFIKKADAEKKTTTKKTTKKAA